MHTDAYHPINCEFHDVLEATATQRRSVPIQYLDAQGMAVDVHARIVDLGARAGAEYMQLDDGSTVRLDRIVSVDEVEATRFDG